MDLLEIIDPFVKYVAMPLIGMLGWWITDLKKNIDRLKQAHHNLELKMKEKIDRDEAAKMIADATHGIERKLDKIYDYILENKNG
jgi:DNA-binding transcriptional regulator GbsR (MarR family)